MSTNPEGRSAVDLTSAVWRKSARSGNNGGACVEVASLDRVVAVRDSKNPDGPRLTLTRAEWRALTDSVRRGEFDNL